MHIQDMLLELIAIGGWSFAFLNPELDSGFLNMAESTERFAVINMAGSY